MERHTSKVFIYSVAAGIGLTFSLTLLHLAWRNALDGEAQKFSYASISLKETLARSVTGGDDVTNNLATLFEGMDHVSEGTFRLFAHSVLSRYPFIDAVSYHPLTFKPSNQDPQGQGNHPPKSGMSPVSRVLSELDQFEFPAKLQMRRDPQEISPPYPDLSHEPMFQDVLRTVIETGNVAPTPSLQTAPGKNGYLLLKPVYAWGETDYDSPKKVKGIVATFINPRQLFSQSSLYENLFIHLSSVSEGVTGRQKQFEKRPPFPERGERGLITWFREQSLTQFPNYSMRLVIDRAVHWDEIEKGLILTALVLGAGMSLLLVALARAKEHQAKELRERNTEIEREVRRQTKELAKTRDKALEASRVKSEFLASMSHEIRTPLNAIIGMAELLEETPLTPDQERYVNIYKKAGEALQSLVNDILDLSKIEANQLLLENIDFDLRVLIDEAVELYALKCDEKGLELICSVAPDVPAFVKGDPSRLRQVVLNLIGNAAKFTEKGEIVVQVMRDRTDPEGLVFSVSDTGIGIPTDKLETIFGSFTQVDSSTTRKYGGTGLGLTISKRLVELMGGRVWVQSEQGKGSTFSFFIRLERAHEPVKQVSALPMHLGGMDVLVVDDNSTNRLILRETLTAHGAVVHEAGDGQSALAAFRQAREEGREFKLILLDGQMPGMDGFAVAEAIKAAGGNVKTVLMLTSSQLSGDLSRAQALGVEVYLVKPVKWSELHKAIWQALEAAPIEDREKTRALETGESRIGGKIRILLVEDTADNRLLVQAYLKGKPYLIDEAENGEIALEKFKSQCYSLVLMDVQMPVMDGHESTRRIRAWEKEQERKPTPIIALTAHAIKQEVEKSLAAGCNAHLNKPIRKATLLQAIEQYVVKEPLIKFSLPLGEG